ncbi:Os08g0199525 [Oryza sativa Japonica Group]|uniref:Os08g0199525 protein n=1 Tax=Oryza sativa subsp. japonica TaxID=39947 RepID=A0A0P0XCQ6_ORYSJ|nr:hypothetical protein EE612_042654 [Oryza sativa]BAT04248.1 Os08g0199525 [Oryza sativa Japonica Group]
MPERMRRCTARSTSAMSKRPERYMYRLSTSPWRFSSADHPRIHRAHAVASAPVRSPTARTRFSELWYVGSASSVTMFATRHTRSRSGTPAARSRSSAHAAWNPSPPSTAGSGSRSDGCHAASTGFSSGSTCSSTHGSICVSTSSFSGDR